MTGVGGEDERGGVVEDDRGVEEDDRGVTIGSTTEIGVFELV